MKLRGKLILSCTALAAVATTAFSTTYAWYISNSVVSANGVTAGTTSSGSDTLQISLQGTIWRSSVTVGVDVQSLIPVQYGSTGNVADGTYPTWAPSSNAATGASPEATAGAYCDFNLFFRNPNGASGSKVYLKQLTATNTTAASTSGLPAEKILTGTGLGLTDAQVQSTKFYQIDLLRALDLEIISSEITVGAEDFVGASSADTTKLANNASGVTTHVYGFDNYATDDDDFTAGTTNAHEYYNAFKGLTDTAAIPTADKLQTISQLDLATAVNDKTDAVEIGGAAGQTYLKTTWRLFINGWDLACFDAIKGQTLQFSMVFDTFSA